LYRKCGSLDVSKFYGSPRLVAGIALPFLPIMRSGKVGKARKIGVNVVEIESREILEERDWKKESLDRQVWRRRLKKANTD
jgi:hypothetical protein